MVPVVDIVLKVFALRLQTQTVPDIERIVRVFSPATQLCKSILSDNSRKHTSATGAAAKPEMFINRLWALNVLPLPPFP